jgi:hypothetical protein
LGCVRFRCMITTAKWLSTTKFLADSTRPSHRAPLVFFASTPPTTTLPLLICDMCTVVCTNKRNCSRVCKNKKQHPSTPKQFPSNRVTAPPPNSPIPQQKKKPLAKQKLCIKNTSWSPATKSRRHLNSDSQVSFCTEMPFSKCNDPLHPSCLSITHA